MAVLLFNTVFTHFIVIAMYYYCMFMYLHRATCLSSATLTEDLTCFFLSCMSNARVKPSNTVHGPQSSNIFVLFYVLFVLCRSVYCMRVNVYCTYNTAWLPNCNWKIYHIILDTRTFHIGFVIGKVVLWQVFLQVLLLALVCTMSQ
jgi:hypothetical protein